MSDNKESSYVSKGKSPYAYANAIPATNLIAPTDRLSKAVLSGEAQENTYQNAYHQYITGTCKGKITYVSMDAWDWNANKDYNPLDPNDKIDFLGAKLNNFDHAVYNAALSLIVSGNKYFTTPQVAAVMFGMAGKKHSGYRFTETQLTMITESLRKLMGTKIILNCSQESEKFVQNHPTLKQAEGIVLPLERNVFVMNGLVVEGFRYLGDLSKEEEFPILYRYAKSKNQIQTMPVSLLDTPCKKTEWTIKAQEYLRQRIAMLESEKAKHVSNKVLISTLFSAIDFTTDGSAKSRKQKSRLLGQIAKALDYWKGNDLIGNYKFEYEDNNPQVLHAIIISK